MVVSTMLNKMISVISLIVNTQRLEAVGRNILLEHRREETSGDEST
jgi:hypothetical protein